MGIINDSHIVIKREDVEKYLNEQQKEMFNACLDKIDASRRLDGKHSNKYYICNLDEPYSKEVLSVILQGEYCKVANNNFVDDYNFKRCME